MSRTATTALAALVLALLLVAGCGGESSVSAEQRIERCLQEQPDASKADCEGWEADGELDDEGRHTTHEEM